MEKVYGPNIKPMMEPLRDVPFPSKTAEILFGEIWSRPQLSIRDRRLLVIGATAMLGRADLIEQQVAGALLNKELTPNSSKKRYCTFGSTPAPATRPRFGAACRRRSRLTPAAADEPAHGSVDLPEPPQVAGTSLAGTHPYVISAEENRALCESTGVAPAADGTAHPIYFYIATQVGMGMTVAGLCAACEFDVEDGPMMASSKVDVPEAARDRANPTGSPAAS